MKKLNLQVPMEYSELYRPTSRHRKIRKRIVSGVAAIEVAEVSEKEFPVAFRVTKHQSLYRGAVSYKDMVPDKYVGFVPYTHEIRYYQDKLYKACPVSYGAAISTELISIEKLVKERLSQAVRPSGICEEDVYIEGESLLVEDNREDICKELQKIANKYVVFDGKVWFLCDEPGYRLIQEEASRCITVSESLPEELGFREWNALEEKPDYPQVGEIEVLMPEKVKSYHPRYLSVTVTCMASYESQIKLPKEFSGTREEAIQYAKEHLDELPMGYLEYIIGSDELDEENCDLV